MIELKNAAFSYEDRSIFKNLSFKINEGEKVALLGANGSGKTTLLRILGGLYFLEGGEYLFREERVDKKLVKKTDFFRKIGFLFQQPESMIFTTRVKDEILWGLEGEDLEAELEKISYDLKIENLLEKNPLYLSGGEKQKVLLAAALLKKPEILLLDEPISQLDPFSAG